MVLFRKETSVSVTTLGNERKQLLKSEEKYFLKISLKHK